MRLFPLRRFALLASLALLLLPALRVAPLRSQESPVRPAMSAGLLKRLGSAVEGYIVEGNLWVVADTAFPYHVWGIVAGRDSGRMIARTHEGSMLFGPYYSSTGTDDVQAFLLQPCKKDQYTQYHCPDSLGTTSTTNISSVTVTVRTKDGHRYVSNFGNDVEALLFTVPAIDRLLLPYYTMLYGAEYTARQRQEILHHISGAPRR